MQMLKIDVILKLAFRQQFNIRARRNEEVVFQTGICIADVFRRKRE